MLNKLITAVALDATIYFCALALILLLWLYHRTRDKDFLYFALADASYLLGELCLDTVSDLTQIPVDCIFFISFYFFIFLFLKNRTKVLLKNPIMTEKSQIKTWILISVDYFIVAILSYLLFFYFDRTSLSSSSEIGLSNYAMIMDFLYPVFDFLLLGYYININKFYVVSDRKIYWPLITGLSVWTISDFLIAFEDMFGETTYRIGDTLQILGLVSLVLLLVLIKSSKTDSYYTTINLYRDDSKLSNYNSLMNGVIIIYIAIYIYCFQLFDNSVSFMNTINEWGIVLLILAVLRQNIIHYDNQYQLSKMSRDASTDPLTGFFTRKYAFTLIQSLYKSSLYFNMNISVLMLDIDHFKNYNDTYGHVIGDHVLKDIAQLINSSIDISNILCRYGGEEFLIVLPGIDSMEGMRIAEKIRKTIEGYNFPEGRLKHSGKVTVSIGGATAGSETNNEIDLIEQADAALYKAKEERNKSLWFLLN